MHSEAGSIAPARSQRRQGQVPPRRYAQNLRKMAKLIPLPTQMAPACSTIRFIVCKPAAHSRCAALPAISVAVPPAARHPRPVRHAKPLSLGGGHKVHNMRLATVQSGRIPATDTIRSGYSVDPSAHGPQHATVALKKPLPHFATSPSLLLSDKVARAPLGCRTRPPRTS